MNVLPRLHIIMPFLQAFTVFLQFTAIAYATKCSYFDKTEHYENSTSSSDCVLFKVKDGEVMSNRCGTTTPQTQDAPEPAQEDMWIQKCPKFTDREYNIVVHEYSSSDWNSISQTDPNGPYWGCAFQFQVQRTSGLSIYIGGSDLSDMTNDMWNWSESGAKTLSGTMECMVPASNTGVDDGKPRDSIAWRVVPLSPASLSMSDELGSDDWESD
ncbi:hypothetical protein F5Y15DRAFT_310085 [Xylariaceae sp. FL0016]|nr:hypothetical protein F5Y15DRAFT_310085 [Xylariaceae sp. FL0016]